MTPTWIAVGIHQSTHRSSGRKRTSPPRPAGDEVSWWVEGYVDNIGRLVSPRTRVARRPVPQRQWRPLFGATRRSCKDPHCSRSARQVRGPQRIGSGTCRQRHHGRRAPLAQSACANRSPRAGDRLFACCGGDRPRPRSSIRVALRAIEVLRGQWCRRVPGSTHSDSCRATVANVESAAGTNLAGQLDHVVQANNGGISITRDDDRQTSGSSGIAMASTRPASIRTTARLSETNCNGSKVAFNKSTRAIENLPPVRC